MNFFRKSLPVIVFIASLFATRTGMESHAQQTNNKANAARSAQQTPTVEQIVLGQLSYYRERQISLFLREAQDDLKQGQTRQALQSLQHILDRQADSFVWSEKEKKLVSLGNRIDGIFEDLKKDELDQYRRLYAVNAEKIFEQAKSTGDFAEMQNVVRRFFHTQAGFRANDFLAAHAFDRGEFSQAAYYWMRLLNSKIHRKKVSDSMIAKCLTALKLTARDEQFALLSSQFANKRLKLGNRTIVIDRWLNSLTQKSQHIQSSEIWPLAFGNVRRNRSSEGSLPYWKPHWSIPFQTKETEQVGTIVETWQMQKDQSSLPFAVANSAVAVGEVVYVRDYSGISAIDIETGNVIWFYQCESSLAKSVLGDNADRYSSGIYSPREYQSGAMGNSIFGTLSADDKSVYLIDGGQLARPNYRSYRRRGRIAKRAEPDDDFSSEGNSLIALSVKARQKTDSRQPEQLWKLKGKKGSPLEGAIFLGPPLPVNQRLYAVVELKGVLKLACLKAKNGELIWLQGIGKVEQPIRQDAFRHGIACTLAYSGGVIVCPTQTGLLVAVNADTGSLMWCRYCGDDLEERRSNRASGIDRDVRGHAGFLSVPIISGSQVVFLPPQSMAVQSYDLYSGKPLWRVSRVDGEYLDAIYRDSVLLVGRRSCRSLALKTGSDLWSLPVATPSGVGVKLGSNYLLPLQTGRFSLIDLETGKAQVLLKTLFEKQSYVGEVDPNSNEIPKLIYPENLLVTNSHIVSAGAQRITAYFKSQTLLKQIENHPERFTKNPGLRLQVAELQILNRDDEKATLNLEKMLAEKNLPNEIQAPSSKLLQDLLFKKLSKSGIDADELIARLEKLSLTSDDKLNFYIHKSQWQQRTRQFSQLLDSLAVLSTFSQNKPILWNDDPSHLVSTSHWVAALSNRMYEELDHKTRQQLATKVLQLSERSLKSKNEQDLNNFLSLFDHWAEANAVREELAKRLTKAGKYHRAEIVLLRNLQRAATENQQAKANSLLAELYREAGFHWEVARLLNNLEAKFATALVAEGINSKSYVDKFPANPKTLSRLNQLRAARKLDKIDKIELSVETVDHTKHDFKSLFLQSRKSLYTPEKFPYHLSIQQSSGNSFLHTIERNDLLELGKIEVPLRHSYPEKKRQNFFGHFLPIGSVSQLQGFSFLDQSKGKQVWKTNPFHESGTDEMFQVGPAGPSYCCFQSRQRLVVVDPQTGKILWQMNSLEPFSGLWADSVSGLIGDENVLVLFDRKRSSYTVFRSTSGEIVRRGKLNIDSTKTRRVFGRLLFHFTRAPGDLRMRIWDPLKDEFLLDEPASAGYARTSVVGENIVVLTPARELFAIESMTGKIVFKKRFSEKEVQKIVYLEAFADDARFYICLQQPSSVRSQPQRYFHYYVSNSPLASVHFWGDLYAFDRKTGKQVWKRSLTERSLIRTNGLKFPFLVFASGVADQQQGSKQTMTFEVIESKTGKTLSSIGKIAPDQFYRVKYLDKKNRLEIVGTKSKVLFDLFPQEQP